MSTRQETYCCEKPNFASHRETSSAVELLYNGINTSTETRKLNLKKTQISTKQK